MKCLYCLSFADIDRGNTLLRNSRTYPALAIVFILRFYLHRPPKPWCSVESALHPWSEMDIPDGKLIAEASTFITIIFPSMPFVFLRNQIVFDC